MYCPWCKYEGDGREDPVLLVEECYFCKRQDEDDALEAAQVFGVCPFCFTESDETPGSFWDCPRCKENVVVETPDERMVYAGVAR